MRHRDVDSPFVAPSDDIERVLVAVWEEALGVEGVGVEDDFFEAGGDSLTGLRLGRQIGRRFGVELSRETLFTHPTVASLAAVIRTALVEKSKALSEEEANARLSAGRPKG